MKFSRSKMPEGVFVLFFNRHGIINSKAPTGCSHNLVNNRENKEIGGKMRSPLTAFLVSFAFLFLSIYSSACFGYQQVQAEEVKYIKGKIIRVDFVRSAIIMKFIQENGNSDEITFSVTPHTKINKGELFLSISELKEGDEVVVQYRDYPMSFSSLKAEQINLKSSA